MCTNPSHESSSGRSKGKNVQYIWCRDCFSEAQDINNLEQAQLKHLSDSCFAKPSFALTYWGSRNKRAFVVAQAEQKGERVDTLHVFPCVSSLSFLHRGGGGGGGGWDGGLTLVNPRITS